MRQCIPRMHEKRIDENERDYGYVLEHMALLISIGTSILEASRRTNSCIVVCAVMCRYLCSRLASL